MDLGGGSAPSADTVSGPCRSRTTSGGRPSQIASGVSVIGTWASLESVPSSVIAWSVGRLWRSNDSPSGLNHSGIRRTIRRTGDYGTHGSNGSNVALRPQKSHLSHLTHQHAARSSALVRIQQTELAVVEGGDLADFGRVFERVCALRGGDC